ncbi:hypothetical protein ACHAXN_002442 [Cyclotella atomus]
MTSSFNTFASTPFGTAAAGPFQSANSTMNAPTSATNNTNAASASDANMSEANSAHHFLSRFEGFNSAKLSARANDLERRLGGRLAVAPAASANQEEKKDDGLTTTSPASAITAFHTAPTQDIATLIQKSTSLSQLLSAHHEMCISSALANAQRLQEKRLETRNEQRDASDWESERGMILAAGSRALVPAGGVGRRNDAEMIIPKPQKVTHLPQLAFHVEAIDRYLISNKDREAALCLIDALKQGLDGNNNTMEGSTLVSDESIHQYSNGLSLIMSIVGSANCRSNDSNTTALTNYSANTMASGGIKDRNVQVARNISSSCHFFASQFRTHISDVVAQVQLDGSITNTSNNDDLTPVARDASIFAQVVLGSTSKNGVWGGLFYALRCGDLVAAKSILSGSEEVDAAVVNLVCFLANMQGGNNESIFVSNGNGGIENETTLLMPSQEIVRARLVVSDLYEGVKARFTSLSSAEQTMAYYQAACLAMLGGSESISEASILESSGLVKTVEDYLYASLWHAMHLAQGSNSEVGLKHTCEAIDRLGNLVKEWGPSYFEQEEESDGTAVNAVALQSNAGDRIPRSGGWAYALPLLACQQYGSALAYLAEVGGGLGLMSAAHSAVVMNSAGIDLKDYFAHQSSHSLESKEDEASLLFSMLVSSFSASLQDADVVAALKYLMLLSGKGKVTKAQIQRLILETRQFERIAGKVEQDGSRSKAALDEYFTSKEVSSILAAAAGEAVWLGKSADGAELLVLAGNFASLFSLMNRELASRLVVTTEEEFQKRQFWFNAAKQFHSIHLTNGKNYVQNNLSAEGSMSFGHTFQLLLNLVVFFDWHREQQWENAWNLMDNLALIPKNDTEMTTKMNQFNAFDSYVRREFHHVVVASMEALCHLYRAAKQSATGAPSFQQSTIDQQLNELLERARLLVTFAGVINISMSGELDTYAKLAQLEKNMM